MRRAASPFGAAFVATAVCTIAPLHAAAQTPAAQLASAGPTGYPGGNWQPGTPQYGAMMAPDTPLQMDDGVTLRATIVYPAERTTGARAAGRFPVIVEHTPYTAARTRPNPYFAEHGYIYVAVQARGSGASAGELQRFSPREAQDGRAIVDWAAHRLDGADGRVALIGCSYPAVIALNTAAYLGPNSPVKTVLAACAGLSLNRATLFVSGMPTTSFWNFLERGVTSMGGSEGARKFFAQLQADVAAGGDSTFERQFWGERANVRLTRNIAENDIPVLLWAGWADTNNAMALRTFTGLQNAWHKRPFAGPMTANQPTTPRYQIIMGDWEHGGGVDRGVQLQWFETWVKGVDTGMQKTSTPMHLYDTATKQWINAERYPATSSYTQWRLDAGSLAPRAPRASGAAKLAYADPSTPGARVVFTSLPVSESATLAGPVSATIHARSSNTNMVLLARLYDVAPDGAATLISRGVLLGSQSELDRSASWIDSRGVVIWPWPKLDRDKYLEPGKVGRFEMALEPVHRTIMVNHRLRLEFTTQAPTDICPVSTLPGANNNDPCRATGPQRTTLPGGQYEILYGSRYPSALNLPQMTADVFEPVASGPAPSPSRPNARFTLPLDWGSEE